MVKKTWRMIWLMLLSALMFLGAAFVTLRAAEQTPPAPAPAHPVASKPEESATIADDPTIAPDPAQSADNDISFPTDI